MQGLTLLVTVRDRLEGSLTIDFSEDISFLGPAAGPLVMEQFRRLGASMDQWKDWQATARGPVLTMTGQLTAKELRNVFSLFRLSRSQPVNLAAEPTDKPEPPRAEGSKANVDLTAPLF